MRRNRPAAESNRSATPVDGSGGAPSRACVNSGTKAHSAARC
jgi:hypothetical protein